MSEIKIIEKDICLANTKFIAHCTNAITQRSAGVAKAIFDAFPYANEYKDRTTQTPVPSISICGDGIQNRYVINIYSIVYPGKPKYPNSTLDGNAARLKNFYECLKQVQKIQNLNSIAFPYNICCNLAGGNWEQEYYPLLQKFALSLGDKVEVVLYKKDM